MTIDLPQLRTELVHVTPDMARGWLAKQNIGNRPLSPHIVRRYVEEMKSGKWLLTHQGPAFDYTDYLIDGQHRLQAVVDSGITVPMWITYGADPETFTVLDIGHKRAAAHLIPGPYATIKASATRYMARLPRLVYTNHQQNRESVAIYNQHQQTLDAAGALSLRIYNAARITSGQMAALLALSLEQGTPDAAREAWIDGLVSGAGLAHGDPRLMLRNRFALHGKELNSTPFRNSSLFLIVRSWNAHLAGERLSRVTLPNGGAVTPSDIPVPVFK
jgi:hypothetical protein